MDPLGTPGEASSNGPGRREERYPEMHIDPTSRGKVRDLYDLGDTLLLVASDRLSAFDVVLPDPIPFKGEVLTKLSLHWFSLLGDIVPNHLIS
jgi:phosphoribosylaminoimidazole-succinocarboxamide synthase